MKTKTKTITKTKKLFIVIMWLAIWQATTLIVANPFLLPGPVDTFSACLKLFLDATFYKDILATVWRCLAAILLSIVAGFIFSILSYKFEIIRHILSLPIAILKAVPIMAVAIYMLFLLTSANVPVMVCFMMCFPIVYTNLLSGFDSIDMQYVEMTSLYKIKGIYQIILVYLPSVLPYFQSALMIIAGMSWKAVVTAEVLSVPAFSLGYELMNAKYYLETDTLFAYVITIICISVFFEKLIKHFVKKATPHAYSKSKLAGFIKKKAAKKSCDEVFGVSSEDAIKGESATFESTDFGSAANAISLDGISKSYGDEVIFKDLNLSFPEGKTSVIMGPSGSGKTTLLKIITGIEEPDSGRATLKTDNVAVLFQEDRLLPWLNVYDNILLGTFAKPGEDFEKLDSKVRKICENIGLLADLDKLPDQLSFGMKHRVSMARTAMFDGDIVILDEPLRGLDDENKNIVIEKLWKIYFEGKTVIVITHDRDFAKSISDFKFELNERGRN